jgi:hypothetical protein
MKTTSTILNKDFDFKAIHIMLTVNEDLWQYDKWTVIINGESFDYNTGIGHRKESSKFDKKEFTRLMTMRAIQSKTNLEYHNSQLRAVSKVKPLEIDDVLYSLIMDAQAADGTFQDFCDNFGYDNDSRKALDTYMQCQETEGRIRKFLNVDEAAEKFQDY